MKEIKGLTGLRGYAALWVFFLHATWGMRAGSYAMKVAKLGGSGVIIFFVLSGFILSHTYAEKFADNKMTHGRFMFARLARVYPLHLFTLIAFAFLVSIGYVGIGTNDNPYTFVLNLGLIQSWGITDLISWNQPSWSISTEMFAYLLFPFFIGRLYRASPVALLLAVAAVVYWTLRSPYPFIVSWAQLHGFVSEGGKQFAHGYSLVMFLGVFVSGCVLYCVADRIKNLLLPRWLYDAAAALGVGLILNWCTTAVGDLQLWQGVSGACLIVFGLSRDAGLGRVIFGNLVTHFLGKVSYALYLSALMVEYTAMRFINPLALWENLALCLIVATGLHYWIEQPARRLLSAMIAKGRDGIPAPTPNSLQ